MDVSAPFEAHFTLMLFMLCVSVGQYFLRLVTEQKQKQDSAGCVVVSQERDGVYFTG